MKDKNLLKAYSMEKTNKEFENTLAYSIVALTWLTALCLVVLYALTHKSNKEYETTEARRTPIDVEKVDRNIELTENTSYESGN